MNKEDLQLLRNTVSKFIRKNERELMLSEKTGFSSSLIDELSKAGFLGSLIPVSMGGSELPRDAYFVILNELAKGSPSLAVRVMITNSLFLPFAIRAENSENILTQVSSGKINPAVSLSGIMEGRKDVESVTISGGRVSGVTGPVINSNCNACLFVTKGQLILALNGIRCDECGRALGLNTLGFSQIAVDTDQYEDLGEHGTESLNNILDSIDMEISAIALGIANAALAIAIDYASQRSAFGYQLKDYQPISGNIARMKYEVDYLINLAENSAFINSGELLSLKIRAVDLAEDATNMSLQVHGGYGYFEDFKVERYYRDITTLEALFIRPSRDKQRLATILYGRESGYL